MNNFCKFFPDRNNLSPFYKGFSTLYFSDYYLPWGDPKQNPGDAWDDVVKVDDIKVINNGSVYLSELKTWKKSKINNKRITLLFTSGPLRIFMANLQELTPEKNLVHRKNVIGMLKKLLDQHFNLRIYYKSFIIPTQSLLFIYINILIWIGLSVMKYTLV